MIEPPKPLTQIPEEYREYTYAPEERDINRTDLSALALEVADAGVFTVVPYTYGHLIKCRVLIAWDPMATPPEKWSRET